jgi:hypothetical protein
VTYEITKEIRIHNTEDDWDYVFTTDEYGSVTVNHNNGLEAMHGETTSIDIPRDCIQHFINALSELK